MLAGPLSDQIGIDATLWLSAAVLLGSNLAILAVPSVRKLRALETSPAPQVVEEETEPTAVGLPGVSA
jgi:hypothetical protein